MRRNPEGDDESAASPKTAEARPTFSPSPIRVESVQLGAVGPTAIAVVPVSPRGGLILPSGTHSARSRRLFGNAGIATLAYDYAWPGTQSRPQPVDVSDSLEPASNWLRTLSALDGRPVGLLSFGANQQQVLHAVSARPDLVDAFCFWGDAAALWQYQGAPLRTPTLLLVNVDTRWGRRRLERWLKRHLHAECEFVLVDATDGTVAEQTLLFVARKVARWIMEDRPTSDAQGGHYSVCITKKATAAAIVTAVGSLLAQAGWAQYSHSVDGLGSWFAEGSGAAVADCQGGLAKLNNTDPSTGPATCSEITGLVIVGGSGSDSLDASGVAPVDFTNLVCPVTLTGLAGDDSLVGSGFCDAADGGAGLDTITGGVGNDSLDGGDDDDSITGDVGLDTLLGDTGNDTISGGDDDDSITGGAGLDSLFGDAGNDTISGGDDDDSITGGAGIDNLLGDAGNDTVSGGADNDTITGGAGLDNLIGDDGNDDISGGIDEDSITGGLGLDTMVGDDGNDTISGGNDDDSIAGGAGIDNLIGDDGNDTISGGADNDTITGGLGVDSLVGDDGNDTISGGADNDTITGGLGVDSLVGDDGNDSISGGDDDDSIVGGAGIDTLVGGKDNDSLDGGDDNDVMIWNRDNPDGLDTMDGNNGTDILRAESNSIDTSIHAIKNFFGTGGNDVVAFDISVGVTAAGIEQLDISTGSGNDNIFIEHDALGPDAFDTVTITTGTGVDSVNLSGAPSGNTFDFDVNGNLVFNGTDVDIGSASVIHVQGYPTFATPGSSGDDTVALTAQPETAFDIDLGGPPSALPKTGLVDDELLVDAMGQSVTDDGSTIQVGTNQPITYLGVETVEIINPLSVELASLDAVVDDHGILLSWQTESEVNNAGFEVQHRRGDPWADGVAFQVVGFVDGAGTTVERQDYSFRLEDAEPGVHVFRLRQIEFSGNFEYSLEIKVVAEVAGTHVLSHAFPNPFISTAEFLLAVRESQSVTVVVYDAAGREVDRLFDGEMTPNRSYRMLVDGSAWASGLYVYEATGREFRASRKILLVK